MNLPHVYFTSHYMNSPELNNSSGSFADVKVDQQHRHSSLEGSDPGSSAASESNAQNKEIVTFVSFNQDNTCMSIGTQWGFMIYSLDPLSKIFEERCSFIISKLEMLLSTSLMAIVPSGTAQPPEYTSDISPSSPSSNSLNNSSPTTLVTQGGSCRQVIMWNLKDRCEIVRLNFPSPVTNIKIHPERAVVLTNSRVFIFDLQTMKAIHALDRTPHPSVDAALCALTVSPSLTSTAYLAIPCLSETKTGLIALIDVRTLEPKGAILAHNAPIAALAVCAKSDQSGTEALLATASTKGTVVRLFACPSLSRVAVLRRGAWPSQILSLSFDMISNTLTALSNSGTAHVFIVPLLTQTTNDNNGEGGNGIMREESTFAVSSPDVLEQVNALNVNSSSHAAFNNSNGASNGAHSNFQNPNNNNNSPPSFFSRAFQQGVSLREKSLALLSGVSSSILSAIPTTDSISKVVVEGDRAWARARASGGAVSEGSMAIVTRMGANSACVAIVASVSGGGGKGGRVSVLDLKEGDCPLRATMDPQRGKGDSLAEHILYRRLEGGRNLTLAVED